MFRELWSEARYRLRRLVHREQVDRDIDDEMAFHLEREAEKLRRAGVPSDQALRDARIAFGGMSVIKDDTRDAHGTALLEQLVQDTAYALRGLRARPLFTIVVVITLGLGVGVNTAMFSVLDRALFRPAAFLREPSAVHRVFIASTNAQGKRDPQDGLEYLRYRDFSRTLRTTDNVGAYANRTLAVDDGDDARPLPAAAMSASIFDFFAAQPVLGRFFAQTDDIVGGEPVVVLSNDLWISRFGGRSDALGATLHIDRATYRVIGVAPPGFRAFAEQRAPAVFIPIAQYASTIAMDFDKNYGWSWLNVFVRTRANVSATQLDADLTNAYRASWNAERILEPGMPSPERMKAEAFAAPIQQARGPSAGPEAKVMVWVSGVAFIVLIVACANVANLLLARSLRRRREIAVRRALGGSRGRIIRQLLTETLTLSLLGGIAGLFAAQLTSAGFHKIFLPSTDRTPVTDDPRTIIFALGLTLLTALLAGFVPAIHAGRDDLADSLRGGMREGAYRHSRVRATLLVFQTALSVVLLIGAGLFVRSLSAVRALRLGYDVEPLVFAEYTSRGSKLTAPEMATLGDRLVAEARAIPGVVNATLNVSIPFYSSESRSLYVAGIDSVRKLGRFQLQAGSTDYFATTGTRILRGRGFTSDDRANAPRVAVVSDAMGSALWKGVDPIGQCFRIGRDTMPCTTVVGVAEDMRASKLTSSGEFSYYLPMDQYRAAFGETRPSLYVRVRGRGDDYANVIRARLQRVVPAPAFITTKPLHEIVDPTMRSWQSGATTFLAFGVLALTLAAIGLYAVIAFSVSQRTPELGVRIALGALPGDIVRLVVSEGAAVTLIGISIGCAIALSMSRGIAPLLFQVSPRDPLVYAAVGLLLVVVGIVASLVPAARAARVDPNTALRAE